MGLDFINQETPCDEKWERMAKIQYGRQTEVFQQPFNSARSNERVSKIKQDLGGIGFGRGNF